MKRLSSTAITGIITALVIGGAFLYRKFIYFGFNEYGRGYMVPGHMGSFGMGGTMIIFWILILVGLVLAINWFIKLNRSEPNTSMFANDPVEILKRRYAGGEINRTEYMAKLEDLGK